jgi:carboxypeptidase D
LGLNATYLAQLDALDKSCGYSVFRQKYLKFPPPGVQPAKYFDSDADAGCDLWDSVYFSAYAPNPCFNVYEIGLQCPILSDPLGFPTDLIYSYPGLPVYFNRSDVKRHMNVPHELTW